ncbi:hypothetical protein [Paenibacillus sp. A3M_27_13]|uniref:hypothetical protein n=1 Tax=Paenibacillus sp. A3M_27_13 TaxID=2962029 RepID=UPI0020B68042|nr:hypothetical protein [Paenibacillus sp. A3M_27_13]MCP3746797.1 hypothetical protein [Paenibacillus sp. A3M_27_13]
MEAAVESIIRSSKNLFEGMYIRLNTKKAAALLLAKQVDKEFSKYSRILEK